MQFEEHNGGYDMDKLTQNIVIAERARIEQVIAQNNKYIAEAQSLIDKLTAENAALTAKVNASVVDVPRPVAVELEP